MHITINRLYLTTIKTGIVVNENLKDELREKEVQEPHIKVILDTLDANYHTITNTQENYDKEDNDNEKDEEQTYKGDSTTSISKNEDGKKTYTINKYSQGIPLIESILINNIPYFIQINEDSEGNNVPIFYKKFELADIDLVPPERTEYLSKEYSFASCEEVQYFINRAKNETLDSLFNKVKTNNLKKFIDVDDDFINILAADIIFTYFQDRLGMTHYLLIVGDNNTGKSNILLVFSFLGYRSVYDIAITPANIYNFGSQLEEAQHIIIEDEIDDIDQQIEKKKLYKQSYRSGTKVTRMYENSSPVNNKKRKSSSRQQGFFLFGFKMFASEKMPDKKESKGFLERIIVLKAVPGNPQYDISEVIDESGDEKLKGLYEELMNTRKLLLMYRLLHHKDTIPNVKLNIKNRYKQLTKPLIRLFQNTKSDDDIKKSLSKYLIEKNQEKIDSLDFAILTLIINLSKHGATLYNDQIWQDLKEKYPSGEIKEKPYSWFIEGYGSISKTNITKICETKFGAKPHKDRENGRGLIFKPEILNRLAENYSLIDGGIKIIKDDEEFKLKKESDTLPTCDTFTEDTDPTSDNNSTKDNGKTKESTNTYEEKLQENDNVGLKTSEIINKKTCTSSLELSQVSPLSPNHTKLETPRQRTISKIELGLFTNHLISNSDLTLEDYDYDPVIINNIGRFERSDRWFCNNCTMKGDKWFMMKHPCNSHKKMKG